MVKSTVCSPTTPCSPTLSKPASRSPLQPLRILKSAMPVDRRGTLPRAVENFSKPSSIRTARWSPVRLKPVQAQRHSRCRKERLSLTLPWLFLESFQTTHLVYISNNPAPPSPRLQPVSALERTRSISVRTLRQRSTPSTSPTKAAWSTGISKRLCRCPTTYGIALTHRLRLRIRCRSRPTTRSSMNGRPFVRITQRSSTSATTCPPMSTRHARRRRIFSRFRQRRRT